MIPKLNKKRAVASLVIRGSSARYVPGLGKDDFAVVHAHTIYVVGPNIHGVFSDNQGRCGQFSMPLCAFEELEYVELGEDAVEEGTDDADGANGDFPKAAA